MRANIKLELLSDASPGSGEGLASIIDSDINYDIYGVPFIPSKRLKGVFRDSALDLEKLGLLKNTIKDLFGEMGSIDSSSFRISNGYLLELESIKSFFNKYNDSKDFKSIFNQQSILDYYSYLRSQTSINYETGVAEHNSLRTMRVLKKGLEFIFSLEFDEKYKDDIEKICKITRNFGSSRTRGLGHIKVTLNIENITNISNNADRDNSDFNDNELCRINLKFENLSQLMLVSEVSNKQESDSYISGSLLLGSLAGLFIKNKNLKDAHENKLFKELFLDGKVIFSNLYTSINYNIYTPTPFSFVKEKDSNTIKDLSYEESFQEIKLEEIKIKGKVFEFSSVNEYNVHLSNIPKEIEYHHRRDDRKLGHATKDQGEFFQFSVIKSNQIFSGNIVGEYKYIKELYDLLYKDQIMYFGKSKTAQYGSCKLLDLILEKVTYEESFWSPDSKICIIFESDMILRNQNGAFIPNTESFLDELTSLFNISSDQITIESSFLKTKHIGGFLGVWKLPKIQVNAFSAGSCLVLKNNSEEEIDISKINNYSFGFRTEEGFGRVKSKEKPYSFEVELSDIENIYQDDSYQDISLFKDVFKYVIIKRLENNIKTKAIKEANNISLNISNSFIGRMILFSKNSNNFEEFNSKVLDLKETAKKTLNKINEKIYIQNEKVNIDQFKNQFLESDLQKNYSIRDIAEELSIEEKFYETEENIFEFYCLYIQTFLTILKLQNRKKD